MGFRFKASLRNYDHMNKFTHDLNLREGYCLTLKNVVLSIYDFVI